MKIPILVPPLLMLLKLVVQGTTKNYQHLSKFLKLVSPEYDKHGSLCMYPEIVTMVLSHDIIHVSNYLKVAIV